MTSATRGGIGNLPGDLTSFVGRRREVTEARRLLAASRLVTLTGVGGVGKTRLALRVAADSRRSFDDGVWLVEFGERHDAQLVPDTVAAVLRLREQAAVPTTQILTDYLAPRKSLLVLDNCEHLIDAVAKLAETLLRACPDLRILATSREPLAIDGETVLTVPPLTLPAPAEHTPLDALAQYEAVNLFVERASAAVPGFELTDGNREAVVEICAELDGIPLAIELAAARLRAMSVTQLRDRLTDRFRILTGGGRTVPDRQQTLRTSIDWSHELCTPAEQTLWRRLSVFPHGFELDAAEAIAGGDLTSHDLLDVVVTLVDKSILVREQYGDVVRYRLLETLRSYGLERLRDAGEYATLRLRHRDWYLQLVQRVGREWLGPGQAAWLARLRRERASLRDALTYCLDEPGQTLDALRIVNTLTTMWISRGLLNEARLWVGRALAATEGTVSRERVEALTAATVLAANQSDGEAGRALLAQASDAAARISDPLADAVVTHAAGYLELYTGDVRTAEALFHDVLDVFRTRDHRLRLITTLLGLGLAAAVRGDRAATVAYADEVLDVTGESGESVYRSYALYTHGLAVWADDPDEARTFFEQATQLSREVDDLLGLAAEVEALSWTAAATQQPRRAAILLGAADSLWQSVGIGQVAAPGLRAHRVETEERVRRELGLRRFDAATRIGADLTPSQVVDYAVDDALPDETSPERSGRDLTPREREVAGLVAQGLTNREIAEALVISLRTAQGHVEHVLAKLGFTSRTQIAAWVADQGRQAEADAV